MVMDFLPQIHHSEAEVWLQLLKATLPSALSAYQRHDGIISFGGYLSQKGAIVFIGDPEVPPPAIGITSWVIAELQKYRSEALVAIRYSPIFYQREPALQIDLESPAQNAIVIYHPITFPEKTVIESAQKRIW
jgi:hypothetical protein